jgi:hypothetical protein
MDDREKVEEQVEDLEVEGKDAEQVKGGDFQWGVGRGITANDDWEAPVAGRRNPGGTEHQHNETLVRI